MRAWMLIVLVSLVGCSAFEGFSSGPKFDPNAIYVDREELWNNYVRLTKKELDSGRYKCWDAVLICESTGTWYECSCEKGFRGGF